MLGDVRSLIPDTVHVMALTATATKRTRQAVIKLLKMVHPKVVSVSPNKPNIKYSVLVNTQSLEEKFAPLVEEVRQKRTATDRTIIFCRTYDQCAHIYVCGESVRKRGNSAWTFRSSGWLICSLRVLILV